MINPALKVAPQVNLDEFEHRLRAAATSQSGPEDPLAELARLVGLENLPQRSAENVVTLASRSADSATSPVREPLIRVSYTNAKAASVDPPQLRRTLSEPTDAHDDTLFHSAATSDEPVEEEIEPGETLIAGPVAAAASNRRRGGRWFAAVSALSLLGVLGIGSAVALKYGAIPSLRKAPPVIIAWAAPTKVAPPSVDTVAPPNDTASVLFKDQSAKPAPVKVVSNEEQPVDLRAQSASFASIPPPPPAPAPTAAAPTAAQVSSPIAPNPATPLVATADANPAGEGGVGSPLFAEPKKVKTVSVRPDGTLIAKTPAPGASAAPAVRSIAALLTSNPTVEAPVDGAAAQSATPKLDLPVKPRAKLTARVQPGKTIDAPATAAATSDVPLQLTPPTKLEKAARTARAKTTAATIAAALPATPAVGAPADPAPTASAPDATATVASAGNYAVQLAAPASDQEAQNAAARLKAKYSSELNGLEPTVHKADVTSGTVYRVRVGALSKADAVALCEKLKANGGACFVARN